MGVLTDAILCYGVAFEEDHEFPWSGNEEDDEFWYYNIILKYNPLHRLYDDDGAYLKDTPYEVKEAEWDNYKKFRDQNPKPYQLVRHCSNEYPMYILAIPSTVKKASRGYPEKIYSLRVDQSEFDLFYGFLVRNNIISTQFPQWLLASYWG